MTAGGHRKEREEPRGEGRKAFLLRLSPALLEELRTWAARDLRSLNGQIEFLLRESLRRRRRQEGPPESGSGDAARPK